MAVYQTPTPGDDHETIDALRDSLVHQLSREVLDLKQRVTELHAQVDYVHNWIDEMPILTPYVTRDLRDRLAQLERAVGQQKATRPLPEPIRIPIGGCTLEQRQSDGPWLVSWGRYVHGGHHFQLLDAIRHAQDLNDHGSAQLEAWEIQCAAAEKGGAA